MIINQSEQNTDAVFWGFFFSDCEVLRDQVTEMSAMKEIPNEYVHGFKQEIIALKLKVRDSDLTSEPHAVGS